MKALDVVLDVMEGSINVYFASEDQQMVVTTNNFDGSPYELTYMENDVSGLGWYKDAIGKEEVDGSKVVFQKPYSDYVTGKSVITLTQEVVFDGKTLNLKVLRIIFSRLKS